MPMAAARSGLSRTAIKVAPQGEDTQRRASANSASNTVSEYQAAV